MPHDFKRFPELTNNQMDIYYFESPHKQITEDFRAKVVKVIDGDTVRVTCNFRDFDFPVRLSDAAAPEQKERGGLEGRDWLAGQILGEDVDIILSRKRVEKWGRLLGDILFKGISMNEEIVREGLAVKWSDRTQGSFFKFTEELSEHPIQG